MRTTLLLIVLASAVSAQPRRPPIAERAIRAALGGPLGDHGKCTIEVDVDDVAEVEIFQDQGRLRTISGQPSEWRRMQCNTPLPSNPAGFEFHGVDGRGRVTLQRDPRQNGGVAVVLIEDPKGGREGYTFDLIWRNTGGDRPVYAAPAPPDPGPGYRDDRRWETVAISCFSDGGRRRYCDADTSRGALLLRPRGPAECRFNVTWGFDQRGIWVDRGCAADFQVGR